MAKLTIKDKDYDIPTVTLGQLRGGMIESMKKSDEMAKDDWLGCVMLRGEIIAKAMIKKYPDLTEEDILDSLDPQQTNVAFLALLGISPAGETPATRTEAGT